MYDIDWGPRMGMVAEARAVGKHYETGSGGTWALRDVDLEVPEGAFIAVMGPSGSGKSTLLHLLGALDKPSEGAIEIGGRPLAGMGHDQLAAVRRHQLGIVFQSFNLIPVLSARDNVALPAVLAGRPRQQARDRADSLLSLMGLADRVGHLPSELSGGEQQRVAVARALVLEPGLLLADEPTGNLDSASAAELVGVLGQLHEAGQAILLVTHDPVVAAAADEVVGMRDGRIVERA